MRSQTTYLVCKQHLEKKGLIIIADNEGIFAWLTSYHSVIKTILVEMCVRSSPSVFVETNSSFKLSEQIYIGQLCVPMHSNIGFFFQGLLIIL